MTGVVVTPSKNKTNPLDIPFSPCRPVGPVLPVSHVLVASPAKPVGPDLPRISE